MQPHTIHIIRTVVFLLAIAWLAGHVRRPYDELDGYFTESVNVMAGLSGSENETLLATIDDFAKWPGEFEKVRPFLERAHGVDSLVKQSLSILSAANLDTGSADSLQFVYNSCIYFMLATVSQDSAQLSAYVENVGNELSKQIKRRQWWMKHFATLPTSKKELMMAIVRKSLLATEKMVVKRLAEISYPRCCFCFDSTFVLPLHNDCVYPVGVKVPVWLIMSSLENTKLDTAYYNGVRLKSTDRHMGQWEGTADSVVGLHKIAGEVRWRYCVQRDEKFFSLPWSLSYYVAGKGLSLIHSSSQFAYRNYPNAITVSIPGYPPDNVKLRAKNATVAVLGDGKWTIKPSGNCGDSVIVFADATDVNGHTMCVHSVVCRVIDMPSPALLLRGKSGGMMSLRDLSEDPTLTAIYTSDRELEYFVTGCSVLVVDDLGHDRGAYTLTGNSLTSNKELQQLLGTLKPGAHLYFTDCKVKAQDGTIVDGLPLSIELY